MAISGRLVYVLPSENLSPLATGGGVDWAVNTGTGDSGYPPTNLGDLNPAKPAKLTSTTGSWVRDLGSAKEVQIAGIVMHNLTAGLNVRLQGNATNAWGAPSLDLAFTIPAYHEDGMPVNAWINVLDNTANAGARTFQFWRVVVVGVNAAAVAVGDVVLGSTLRQMTPNIHWGLEESDEHLGIEHKTSFGVCTYYDFNTKIRHLRGESEQTDSGLAALKTWHRACKGKITPTFVVWDPLAADAAMLVRWADENLVVTRNFKNSSTVKLGWDEVSRGMPL